MNGEDNIMLSSLCKWSACRMYIEMPYKTKQTHKVVKTPSISQFSHSETHKIQNWADRAYLLN